MFVCARDIVARTPDFDILAANMTLRPWQWEMLHAFDDRTSLGAIARRIGVDLGSITDSLSALEQHGLIKIRTVTREEYRRVFEQISPNTSAPDVLDEDEEIVRPVASKAPPVEGAPQAKPVPPTGEPLSVRLEALRAKAEQAQAQRPPSADTAPFQAHAEPIVVDEPAPTPMENAEVATHTAAVEIAQAPPEPVPDTAVFKSKLADLKARLDESLAPAPAAAAPGVEPPAPAPAVAPVTRDAFADLSESLAAEELHVEHSAGVDDDAPLTIPKGSTFDGPPTTLERNYATTINGSSNGVANGSSNGSTNGNGNGNGASHGPIAFSLSGESAKAALSPDAIEFSLGGSATPDAEPPKPPPLKY
jgi:hypothetical protein